MARLPLKSVPWIAVMRATVVVADHWRRIPAKDRERVAAILSDTKGLPTRMTQAQRRDIMNIARKIDHRGLAADLAPIPVPGLRGRGAKRKR